MQREKNKFELAQTEVTNQIQSQLDAAMKQIRNIVQKSEDMEEELKKSQKTYDGKNYLLYGNYDHLIKFSIRSFEAGIRKKIEGI